MKKIATDQELIANLTSLVDSIKKAQEPSRTRIVAALRDIAFRVEAGAPKVASDKTAAWEGKLVGKFFRLKWSHDDWNLEELPVKGKKKLEVAHASNPLLNNGVSYTRDSSVFIPENVIHKAGVSSSDTYDSVKNKPCLSV